jgi:hypothetical protein
MFRLCVWPMSILCVFVFPSPDLKYKFLLALGVCSKLYMESFCLCLLNAFLALGGECVMMSARMIVWD